MGVKRLTIELPVEQYEYLQKKAQAGGKTVVGVLRQLIEGDRKPVPRKHSRILKSDPLYRRAGSFDGPQNLSEEHDKYLYGKDE